MKVKSILIVLLIGAGVLLASCKCGGEPCERRTASDCSAPQKGTFTNFYPESKANAIRLDKKVPCEVSANQPFDYQLKVTNRTNTTLQNVVVTDMLPSTVKFQSSEPQVETMPTGEARWVIGELGPKESRTINATAIAEGKGVINSCADVTYERRSCAQINIVESQLRITKTAPSDVLACDRIPVKYTVINDGDGAACSISIRDSLQPGLTGPDGKNEVSFDIPSLGAGKSEEFDVMLDAKPGMYESKAILTSATGDVESNVTQTKVTVPSLAISEMGPDSQYIGRSVTYEITVTNNGDAVAKDTVLEAAVPEEFGFGEATMGGNFTHSSPGKVTWDLGTIEPGASRTVSMTLNGSRAGDVTTQATAKAYCAEAVSASTTTSIKGVPGVLLEMVDIKDPIEVGQQETYEITVTNQGSLEDKNINITCTLGDNMEYVSSTGPTQAEVDGKTIKFSPLGTLAPQAQAKWQVVIKASAEGNERFKVSMTTDEIGTSKPVEEIESTTFYQ